MSKKLTVGDFIKRAKNVHGDRYDYSKVEYKSIDEKIIIMCREHGEFLQSPYLHLNGSKCKKCYYETIGKRFRKTNEQFIKESKVIHGDRYDYSLVEYTGNKNKVKIICSDHGEFKMSPIAHINQKQGCKYCGIIKNSINKTLTTEEFIKKAKRLYGDMYDYKNVNYKGTRDNINIICKIHGEFKQRPNDHLCGKGCVKCSTGRISKQEKELLDFIENNYDNEIVENSKNIISPLELDIYLPDIKLAIEYNGLYWHSERYKDNKYHLNKTNVCEEHGIHLIHIYEDDWLYKQDIVKSRLLNLLGKSDRIYARKCEMKEVSKEDSKNFLKKNHLQGNYHCKVSVGLYFEGELVSLMTFGNLRISLGMKATKNEYELLRFCNKLNTSVIGAANKLYKFFTVRYNPSKIITYADRSWSMDNGNALYDHLGFEMLGTSRPGYHYIVGDKRRNRFSYRKNKLVEQGYDKTKSERKIMTDRGIYRIYNSGNLKYINTYDIKC